MFSSEFLAKCPPWLTQKLYWPSWFKKTLRVIGLTLFYTIATIGIIVVAVIAYHAAIAIVASLFGSKNEA